MRDQEPSAGRSEQRLTTKEAAELLGVKPETVYAYVSRGQLSSRRVPGGRGSTFDAKEVEALARRNRRESSGDFGHGRRVLGPDPHHTHRAGPVLLPRRRRRRTGHAPLLRRGRRVAVDQADCAPASSSPRPKSPSPSARRAVGRAARTQRADRPVAGRRDRGRGRGPAALRPLRGHRSRHRTHPDPHPRRRPAVRSGVATATSGPLARRLWARLSGREADEASLRVLDTALALLVDHDLAASTLAVRVAASARAHAYAAVSAGLGVLEGPLHGAASGLAHRHAARRARRGDAAPVIAEELRAGRRIPGLGHRLYPREDPRARVLFAPPGGDPRRRTRPGRGARRRGHHRPPHVAARQRRPGPGGPHRLLGHALQAGETIFAVARTAGWIAHTLEEYAERPLRMRPSGHYVGPRPPQPLPSPE